LFTEFWLGGYQGRGKPLVQARDLDPGPDRAGVEHEFGHPSGPAHVGEFLDDGTHPYATGRMPEYQRRQLVQVPVAETRQGEPNVLAHAPQQARRSVLACVRAGSGGRRAMTA
jgi:hypothetical protein